jgi:hypothetical protein
VSFKRPPKRPHEIRPSDEIVEDRDTEPDHDREEQKSPARRRSSRKRAKSGRAKASSGRPVLRTRAISDEEALAPAALARVRVREAIVRRQDEKEPTPPTEPTGPVEVRIDFVRSRDKKQKIERVGADGFRVIGVAEGGDKVSVGVDGLIFGVTVEAGDSPAQTVERLVIRLGDRYTAVRPDPATAILRERALS